MRRLFLLPLLLCTILSAPARAQETQGDVTAEDIKAAQSYAPLAEAFGQERLAFIAVDRDNARMMLEFLGGDETLQNWTRMVTINMMGLPDAPEMRAHAVYTYIDMFRALVAGQKDQGLAVELKGFAGFSHTPPGVAPEDSPLPQHALYQFAIGQTTPDEDNAGIIYPHGPWLMNFQIQRRGGQVVTEEDVTMLRNLVMNNMDDAIRHHNDTQESKE